MAGGEVMPLTTSSQLTSLGLPVVEDPSGQEQDHNFMGSLTQAAAKWFKWQQNEKRLGSTSRVSLAWWQKCPDADTHSNSTSFGIGEKDFLTFSEGQSTQFDQFDTLYGLDIIIVFSPIKNRYLSQPKYLLSAFQMPLC